MSNSNIRFWVLLGLIISLGVVAFTVGLLKTTEPVMNSDSPFTDEEPVYFDLPVEDSKG